MMRPRLFSKIRLSGLSVARDELTAIPKAKSFRNTLAESLAPRYQLLHENIAPGYCTIRINWTYKATKETVCLIEFTSEQDFALRTGTVKEMRVSLKLIFAGSYTNAENLFANLMVKLGSVNKLSWWEYQFEDEIINSIATFLNKVTNN